VPEKSDAYTVGQLGVTSQPVTSTPSSQA
jgi:hypothetical protein